MIQINLVPDIKQELIRAERVRTSVISIAIITGIAAVGIVVLLAIWVFGVQLTRGIVLDNAIKDNNAKITQIEDLSHTLTIQKQLEVLPSLHNSKGMNSRLFAVLTTINPAEPNGVGVTTVTVDSAAKTIMLEAQALNGYPALEAFRKTIAATKLEYTSGDEKQSVPLTSQITDGERSYGEDADGRRVLRFTLTFTYADELFSPTAEGLRIVAPSKSNATDSLLGVPESLFTTKASDIEEGDE